MVNETIINFKQVTGDLGEEIQRSRWDKRNRTKTMEYLIHGLFLIMGLITVGCVLLITVYLVISGIPAICLGRNGHPRLPNLNMVSYLLF